MTQKMYYLDTIRGIYQLQKSKGGVPAHPMLLSRCGIPAGCMITMVMEKQKADVFLESVIACKLVILLQNTKGRFLLMWIILHM
jgi:hypothetical protein